MSESKNLPERSFFLSIRSLVKICSWKFAFEIYTKFANKIEFLIHSHASQLLKYYLSTRAYLLSTIHFENSASFPRAFCAFLQFYISYELRKRPGSVY